jgi:hypothetical protein
MSRKESTTRIRLSCGSFRVTARRQKPGTFRVTVSDDGDEVSDLFPYSGKARLGVQELARAFVWILMRAKNGTLDFEAFQETICPDNLSMAYAVVNHEHCQGLLKGLSYMDVTADMIPSLIVEICDKYDLGV